MRCNDAALAAVTIAKFRRGPYGSGRFWSELKESLKLFLTHVKTPNHPLVQLLKEAICSDHGLTSVDVSWDALKHVMEKMLVDVLGPGVEFRRWWSVYDSVDHCMPLWHTMLLALMAHCCMNGEDPFQILRTVRPVVVKTDDQNAKVFKYKHQVLLALYDTLTKRLMESMLAVYRRIRVHHAKVTDDATNPQAGLRYLQFWANPDKWVRQMIAPTVKDALGSITTWRKLGIGRTLSTMDAPLLDAAFTKVFTP